MMNQDILRAVSFLSETIAQLYTSGVVPKAESFSKEFSGKIPLELYNRIIEEIQLHVRRYNYQQACATALAAGKLSEFMAEYVECEDIELALSKALP